jgi:hypothetical protein
VGAIHGVGHAAGISWTPLGGLSHKERDLTGQRKLKFIKVQMCIAMEFCAMGTASDLFILWERHPRLWAFFNLSPADVGPQLVNVMQGQGYGVRFEQGVTE